MISSENVFNLQFINQVSRDMFTERLFLFVLFFLVTKGPATAEDDVGGVDHSSVAVDVI